jgi:quercetin dioxygenase-like cupin family protein
MFVVAIAFIMPVVAQAQDSPQRKELRRVDLSGAAGMEVISSISEFRPGDELPRHLHHGVEAGYVVQGAMVQNPGQPPTMLQPMRRSSIFAMWFTADLRWSVPAT